MNVKRSAHGFTLVEVMIAMVVVAVGLGAATLSVNEVVYNATYLRDKTLASWVAENRLTTVRLDGKLPAVDETTGDSELAEIRWLWKQKVSETGVKNLLRIDISVSSELQPDSTLITVSGFVGLPVPVSDPDSLWAGSVDAKK